MAQIINNHNNIYLFPGKKNAIFIFMVYEYNVKVHLMQRFFSRRYKKYNE